MPERKIPIASQRDLISARQATREVLRGLGFGLADQTRAATAVSEIVRNVLRYARAGMCTLHWETAGDQTSVEIVVEDQGPGIGDPRRILKEDTHTFANSGMGILSARRLMHTFDIKTAPTKGTRVTMTMSRRNV